MKGADGGDDGRPQAAIAEHLEAILRGMPTGVVVQDSEGLVVAANPAAERILGRSFGALRGMAAQDPRWEAIHDDGRPFPAAERPTMVALASGKTVGPVRMGVRHPAEGEHRWLLVSAAPLFEPGQPTPVLAYATFQDVSEQVRVERALRTSEERYRSIVDASPMGMHAYRLEDDDRLVFYAANPAADRLTGLDSSQFIGKTIEEAFPPLTGTEIPAAYRQVCRTGEPWHTDQVIYEDEQISGAFEVHAFRTGPQTMAVLFLDTTERTRAVHELRASELRYRTLADAAPLAIALLDAEGRIKQANRWLATLHGFANPDEAVGLTGFDLVAPEDRPLAERTFRAALATGTIELHEIRGCRRDGSIFDAEVAATAVPGRDGAPVQFVLIARDITARRQAAAALLEAERRAARERIELQQQLAQAQKMDAIGQLAGGVAHDFNNLLTGISGYAELLLMRLDEHGADHADVQEISNAADRAAALTNQLLAFSRKQVISPEVLDLNEAISHSQRMLGRIIGEDIELRFVGADALWRVRVDPSQVDQILVNLAANARDALPDGGKLTIETQNVVLDQAYADQQLQAIPGEYVLLAVSDNGSGMDAATQRRAFEPFFSTKEVGRGTGLGLAMIYGIVRRAEGFITIYSEEGVGTTVKIYLPRVDAELSEPRAAEREARPRGHETVLIVEDDPVVRELARRLLDRQGYRVLLAANGPEACALPDEHIATVELLLTDVVMPRMNGRVLYESLLARRPGLRVLYMSGYTQNVIAHHGVLEEGTFLIQKPFSASALANKVREVLDS